MGAYLYHHLRELGQDVHIISHTVEQAQRMKRMKPSRDDLYIKRKIAIVEGIEQQDEMDVRADEPRT